VYKFALTIEKPISAALTPASLTNVVPFRQRSGRLPKREIYHVQWRARTAADDGSGVGSLCQPRYEPLDGSSCE
jgi:hypothetical protein